MRSRFACSIRVHKVVISRHVSLGRMLSHPRAVMPSYFCCWARRLPSWVRRRAALVWLQRRRGCACRLVANLSSNWSSPSSDLKLRQAISPRLRIVTCTGKTSKKKKRCSCQVQTKRGHRYCRSRCRSSFYAYRNGSSASQPASHWLRVAGERLRFDTTPKTSEDPIVYVAS